MRDEHWFPDEKRDTPIRRFLEILEITVIAVVWLGMAGMSIYHAVRWALS